MIPMRYATDIRGWWVLYCIALVVPVLCTLGKVAWSGRIYCVLAVLSSAMA